MKTAESIKIGWAALVVATSTIDSSAWAADPVALTSEKVTLAVPAPAASTNTVAASSTTVVLTPETPKRLQSNGYRLSDFDLDARESRLKPDISGPVPALIRGNFARFLDSINPFGHDVPVQARPNSALLIGNSPPVAGWRNEISHEPVGMTLISVGR